MILNDNQSASGTNRTAPLPQSRDSSHHLSKAKCPPSTCHTDHLGSREWPGGILLVFWLLMCHRAWKDLQEYWHLHRSDCRNTLSYMHFPHSGTSLGLLTIAMPEAGDFVESLEPYHMTLLVSYDSYLYAVWFMDDLTHFFHILSVRLDDKRP